jgi:hypothetical protein
MVKRGRLSNIEKSSNCAKALAIGTQLNYTLDLSLVAMKTCRSFFVD